MAFLPLKQVLSAPQLKKPIEARSSAIEKVFPAAFYKPTPGDKVVQNILQFERTYGVRKLAKASSYGAASREVSKINSELVSTTLVSTVHNMPFVLADYQGLIKSTSTGSDLEIDVRGAEQIGRQVAQFSDRFSNFRDTIVALLLARDAVRLDPEGTVLGPNQGGTVRTTISSGVPAGNQGQLNILGTGNVITADWSNPGTNILGNLRALKEQQQIKVGNKPLKYAFYGRNVPDYLANNTTLQQYAKFMPAQMNQYVFGDSIPTYGGLTWIPAYSANFDADDGSNQQVFGDDQVTFCPEPDDSWYGFAEGTTPTPGDDLVATDAMSLVLGARQSVGMYAYGVADLDPVSIKFVMGDCFLPFLKNPFTVYQAQVANFATAE